MPLLCSRACAQGTEPSEGHGELFASREGTGHPWGHTAALGSPTHPTWGQALLLALHQLSLGLDLLVPQELSLPASPENASQQLLTFSFHKLQSSRSAGWEPSWSPPGPHPGDTWGAAEHLTVQMLSRSLLTHCSHHGGWMCPGQVLSTPACP